MLKHGHIRVTGLRMGADKEVLALGRRVDYLYMPIVTRTHVQTRMQAHCDRTASLTLVLG